MTTEIHVVQVGDIFLRADVTKGFHLVEGISDGVFKEIISEMRSKQSTGVNCIKWGRKCLYKGFEG
jgi:hypothetical protein